MHYRFLSSDKRACLRLSNRMFLFFYPTFNSYINHKNIFLLFALIFHKYFFFLHLFFVVFFSFPSKKKKEKQNLNILGRKLRQTRSGNSSPVHYSNGPHHQSSSYHHNSVAAMGSPYYRDMDEPQSPAGGGHHRSRSASRPPISHSIDYPSK